MARYIGQVSELFHTPTPAEAPEGPKSHSNDSDRVGAALRAFDPELAVAALRGPRLQAWTLCLTSVGLHPFLPGVDVWGWAACVMVMMVVRRE